MPCISALVTLYHHLGALPKDVTKSTLKDVKELSLSPTTCTISASHVDRICVRSGCRVNVIGIVNAIVRNVSRVTLPLTGWTSLLNILA